MTALAASSKKENLGQLPPQLDFASLDKVHQVMQKRADLSRQRKNRTPAQAVNDCRDVPTGHVELNYGPVNFNDDEGEHEEGGGGYIQNIEPELFSPPTNPGKWIYKALFDASSETTTYTFKQFGQKEALAKSKKLKGRFKFIAGTEYFAEIESVERLINGDPENKTHHARGKIFSFKNPSSAVQSFDCTTPPKAVADSNWSSAQFAVQKGEVKVSCITSVYENDVDTTYVWSSGDSSRFLSFTAEYERTASSTVPGLNAWLQVELDSKTKKSVKLSLLRASNEREVVANIALDTVSTLGHGRLLHNDLFALNVASDGGNSVKYILVDLKNKKVLKTLVSKSGYGHTVSQSPSGQLILISMPDEKFKLFRRSGDQLTELSFESTPFQDTEGVSIAEPLEVGKLSYGEAKFVNEKTFVAFPVLPEGMKTTPLQRRARMRVYRLSENSLTHQPIKGSERAKGLFTTGFNSNEGSMWLSSGSSRVVDLTTFRIRPQTFNRRFRGSNILGSGVLYEYGAGLVRQDFQCVRWSDVKVGNVKDPVAGEVLKDKTSFCSRTMPSNSKWNNITVATDESPVIDQNSLEALKIRFQKPNGIDFKKDLKTLLYLFDPRGANLAVNDPKTASLILSVVVGQSEMLYEYILKQFVRPDNFAIRNVNVKGLGTCWSDAERTAVRTGASFYFNSLFDRGETYGKEATTDAILFYSGGILKPALYFENATEAEDAADKAATRLAERNRNHDTFKHVFFSKLYKFAFQYVAPFYGAESKPKIDYTVVRLSENDDFEDTRPGPSVVGLVMSTHKFTAVGLNDKGKPEGSPIGSKASGYGFHFLKTGILKLEVKDVKDQPIPAKLEPIMAHVKLDRVVSKNGVSVPESFTGKLVVNYMKRQKLVPEEREFQIKASQNAADKSLTGLVMFGKDLGDEEYIYDEYTAYFKDRGYKFTPETDLADVKSFATDLIKSDKLDYFVKEAHSDGDEKNMFQFFNAVKMVHGKKTKGNLVQDVYLTRPMPKPGEKGILWPNAEFGAAVKARTLPFTYLNTSCWSVGKAPFEIEQAGSTRFFNIASTTMVDTFYNLEDSIVYQLLNGLFDGKGFDQTRGINLVKNAQNKAGTDNIFIFPGQDEYTEQVESKLGIPVNVDLKVFDSNGKELAIGEST